jgi:biopolymer transport protein TolR
MFHLVNNIFDYLQKHHHQMKTCYLKTEHDIDVMLVLLVIFMMTTPIIQQGVEIDLTTLDEDVLIEDLVGNDPVIISML